MKRRRLLLAGAWLAVVSTAVLIMTSFAPSAEAQSTVCPAADLRRSPVPKPDPVETLTAEDPFLITFGDSRTVKDHSVQLTGHPDVSRADKLQAWLSTDYLENAEGDQISLEQDPETPTGLEARLVYPSKYHALICLTVVPKIIRHFGLGRYEGTVAVGREADGVPLVTVPVELTFRASRWNALLFALVGVGLGVGLKVLSEAAHLQRTSGIGAGPALKRSAVNLTFSVTVVVGVFAGLIVFWKIYGGDPDWGAGGGDVVALIVACFLIQMSSVEGVDLVKKVAGPNGGA